MASDVVAESEFCTVKGGGGKFEPRDLVCWDMQRDTVLSMHSRRPCRSSFLSRSSSSYVSDSRAASSTAGFGRVSTSSWTCHRSCSCARI
jgi:hypothetical protein